MKTLTQLPEAPTQLLKPEAYTSDEWLEREYRELFLKTWHFAGTVNDVPKVGDFQTLKIGAHTLFLVRDKSGEIKAYHNICRHRGTELLEGCGNAGKTIVCPYHRWTFDLDGRLRGIPDQKECFPSADKKNLGLLPAAIAEAGGLLFVCPMDKPETSFEEWFADVPDHIWPHDVTSKEMVEYNQEVVYEMKCNWKVFYENAIDGYHLAYLHENTLGGPVPSKNVWDVHGRHLIWYSTEREGVKNRIPKFVEDRAGGWIAPMGHVGEAGYGGVYMLFPTTTITASPYSFAVSTLEPVDANNTILRVRVWASKQFARYAGGVNSLPGYDKKTKTIKSSLWKKHPLETGDFQTEDVWVVEKMQRALQSPSYCVADNLAAGAGGEAPLTFFQSQVLDYVKPE